MRRINVCAIAAIVLASTLVAVSCGTSDVVVERQCGDGLDNDADGVVDCDDSDCATAPGCQAVCNHNGQCDMGETVESCPDDCSAVCGNTECEVGENNANCPQDCPVCGNSVCEIGETVNCPQDCPVCGNGNCEANESTDCPQDCPFCGNSICDAGETGAGCPQDCPVCGDGICEAGENNANCATDCPVCGNGICENGETNASCSQDCSLCGNAICEFDETHTSCSQDCPLCGDSVCELGENATSCPQDCQLCGNGNIDSNEVCDGQNLNGQSCVSQGFASGTPSPKDPQGGGAPGCDRPAAHAPGRHGESAARGPAAAAPSGTGVFSVQPHGQGGRGQHPPGAPMVSGSCQAAHARRPNPRRAPRCHLETLRSDLQARPVGESSMPPVRVHEDRLLRAGCADRLSLQGGVL